MIIEKFFPWVFVLIFLCVLSGCFTGDDGALGRQGSPDDDDEGGDDDSADDANDDDDDNADDDLVPGDATPSLSLGLVHFHYYGDLGGFEGGAFREDQKWAAKNVDLGIIGWGDEGMERAWSEIRRNDPRGSWLKWRLAQILATNETAGTCGAPGVGGEHLFYDYQKGEMDDFLAARPEYGDGEDCFLHARNDGTIRARWIVQGCDVDLDQKGTLGSAANRREARIFTLVWDSYGWLFDLSGDCARDFMAWRSIKDVRDEGYGGVGFDNLGGMIEDGFYLPEQVDAVDIIEIPDMSETGAAALNAWYQGALEAFLEGVNAQVRQAESGSKIIYNGASYCSWDGGVEWLRNISGEGLGVWCESALEYPGWGAVSTPDRLVSLHELSEALAEDGSFVALETFYDHGQGNPTEEEILFYLAAYDVFKSGGDALAIKPSWNPYEPLAETCWFGIFARDIGAPSGEPAAKSDGIFTRNFGSAGGAEALVIVRLKEGAEAVDYAPGGEWCRVGADNSLTPVSGSISIGIGDGLILLANGKGGIDC